MLLSHPQTTLPTLSVWKNCLPQNWSLVPKSLEIALLRLSRSVASATFGNFFHRSNTISFDNTSLCIILINMNF